MNERRKGEAMQKLGLAVPAALLWALRKLAARRNRTQTAELIAALERHLKAARRAGQ